MEKNLNIVVTKPHYSKQILPVPWPFVISRFHCTLYLLTFLNLYPTKGYLYGKTSRSVGDIFAFYATTMLMSGIHSKTVIILWNIYTLLAGHLIEYDYKSEIMRYFQGRLCDKMGLLCDFFQG